MKKPSIPPPTGDPVAFGTAVKETLEVITGRRGGAIARVNTNGMTGDALVLANKMNELLERLQG